MNTDNIILRETDNLPLINKDDTLTSVDLDGNFIKIYNDFLALSTANDPTLVFDIDRSYAIGEYATYNGKMWVSTIEVTGVTPDIDSLEWLDIFPTVLAHEKNKDTYLDYGGANATSVAEIRAFIDAGLTSTTNLTLTTKTGTSFKIESSTGSDVIIPQATVVDAGLLNAEDKVKLNNISGTNTGDQTLVSLNAEDVDNKVTDFTTINDTLYPTTQAVDTYLTAQIPDLVETFLDSNVEVTTNKAIDFTTVNDTKYPTVKAVDDHINSKLAGLWDDRGSYDASTNLFPSTGGSGGSGAIMKGDIWTINVEGTLGGTLMHVGDTVRALTDAPGQTSINWALLENAIGYVPENVINKVTTFAGNTTSDTKYPSVKAVVDNFDATNIKSILGVTVLSGSNTGDQDLSGLMVKSNNLSDLTNTTTARTNLGLGTLATQSGTFSGTSSGTNTGDQIISDATLTTSDITTNNFSTTKHGFVPKGTNVGNFLKDDGTWGAVASAIPQANTIYVDSVNGVNETTGRGDINKPYLTPEYALSNTTNTGTITGNTATNTTLSAISDVNNASLEVGMYVSGTGIPFGTIIVAKGNQGGDANTVTLSRATTATATGVTVTWIKTYEVRMNGNFVVTSNIFKEGMYINSQTARISWGAFTLFNLGTTVLKTPYSILGEGDYFGTATTSIFAYNSATQSAGFTSNIEFGNIESVTTGTVFNINSPTNPNQLLVKGGFVNAIFGTVGNFLGYGGKVEFNSYGLLGGVSIGTLHTASTSTAWSLRGNHETPISIVCVTANQGVESVGNIYGSTNWTYSAHRGKLRGTTHTLAAGNLDITSRSNVGIVNGSGIVRLDGGSNATIQSLSGNGLTLYGTGYTIRGYVDLLGTINNYGSITMDTNITGTGGIVNNYGDISFSFFNSTFSGTVNNYGSMTCSCITNGALTINNRGILYTSQYGLDLKANAKLYNYGTITTNAALTIGSSIVRLNNSTSVFENYGIVNYNLADTTRCAIIKNAGALKLYQGSVIKISNAKSPVKIAQVNSGTTTSTTAFKLIQSGQDFLTTVPIGARVHNTTDNTWATVTVVDSNTQLTLDIDIMVSGETFVIYGNPDVYYFGVTSNCDGTTYGLTFAFDGSSFAPNDLVGGTLYENINY